MVVPSSSTISTRSSNQSNALRFLTSERTAGTCSARSNWRRTSLALRLSRSATWAYSCSRSSSVHSMPSASATARRARSTLTAVVAVSRRSATTSSGSLPDIAIHVSRFMPCASRRIERSWRRCCISWATRASGTSSSTSSARTSPVFSRSAICAWTFLIEVERSRRSAVSSSRVSNSDASLANSSSRSGRTRSLTSFTVTTNCSDGFSSSSSSPSSSSSSATSGAPGKAASNSREAPASAPTRCSSTSGRMPPEPTS